MDTEKYVPMNELIINKESSWTFTCLNMEYSDIARLQIVLWCVSNLEGRWTMLGGNKFGFEDSSDALSFKIQFGI